MKRLEVLNIHKTYGRGTRRVPALRGVSLQVRPGTTLAVIGESGSGKSTLGRICLGAESFDEGQVLADGQDITALSAPELKAFRRRTSIVLQEPELALNPRRTVGESVLEPLRVLRPELTHSDQRDKALAALEMAHLDGKFWDRFPSELSGGQQQRVGIARAIVTEPTFVVLDEPTASLDLSVRGRILDTLKELQDRLQMTYLLITHDMSTVSALAEDVVVLLKGEAIETGLWSDLRRNPQHPYTRKLLSAVLPVLTASKAVRP